MTESTTGEYLESITCPNCDAKECIEIPTRRRRDRYSCENCNYEWYMEEPLTEDDEDD